MKNKKNDWFSSWFDTPYYHLLYKNRDDSEARMFIEKLLLILNPKPNAQILDLACGKGRHSYQINQLGYRVTGVDLSKNSIEIAKNKLNKNLSFHVHDMRNPFKKNEFDIVFNLFTSFGYFKAIEDNAKVLGAVKQNLKKDGVFVLDFLNSVKVLNQLQAYEEKTIEGICFKISKTYENNTIIKNIEFNTDGENYNFAEHVTAFSKGELETLFRENNLKITHIFGGYTLEKYNAQNSDRLIIIAQKQ